MEWLDTSTANCSVQRTLDVIGEKWSLLVLREAFNGVRRFDDMRRHLGVSESVLTDRLRTLVAAGVLRTVAYRAPGQRSRSEYRLTTKGLDLFPVLIALLQWGDRYCVDGPPALLVTDRATGAPVEAVVRPVGSDRALTARDTVARAGSGARPISAAGR